MIHSLLSLSSETQQINDAIYLEVSSCCITLKKCLFSFRLASQCVWLVRHGVLINGRLRVDLWLVWVQVMLRVLCYRTRNQSGRGRRDAGHHIFFIFFLNKLILAQQLTQWIMMNSHKSNCNCNLVWIIANKIFTPTWYNLIRHSARTH